MVKWNEHAKGACSWNRVTGLAHTVPTSICTLECWNKVKML